MPSSVSTPMLPPAQRRPQEDLHGRRAEVPGTYLPVKHALDLVLAVALLALFWPLIVVLLVLVKVTSRGPALYSQERVGFGGAVFTIYKVRTMYTDCERESGPRWSTPGDPRVTPVGRWLRRFHLDELPQLWNVVRGEMSLVGPRPERPVFVRDLERALPGYRDRLRVRPGVTGLAQVQLPADEDLEGVRRKVACDAVYVRRVGAWLDARVLMGTVLKMLGVPFGVTRRVLRLPGCEAAADRAGVIAGTLQTTRSFV